MGLLSWYPFTFTKSRQLIWRSGTSRNIPDLQIICSDLVERICNIGNPSETHPKLNFKSREIAVLNCSIVLMFCLGYVSDTLVLWTKFQKRLFRNNYVETSLIVYRQVWRQLSVNASHLTFKSVSRLKIPCIFSQMSSDVGLVCVTYF